MSESTQHQSISAWPMCERLLELRPAAFSEAELLAIFIQTGTAGLSAVDVARQLLERSGGLRALLDSPMNSLTSQRGMGSANIARLRAAAELGKRYLKSVVKRSAALQAPNAVRVFLTAKLRSYPYEVFAAVFLDNRHRVVHFQELFYGNLHAASAHPREVIKRALELNAAALIIVHNHPWG